MKQGKFCINICPRHVLPWASLPEVESRSKGKKVPKKRIKSGGHTGMVTQNYKTKVYYSSVVFFIDLDKDSALAYFLKHKAYQHKVKHKSDALKSFKNLPVIAKASITKHKEHKVVNVNKKVKQMHFG